MIGALYFQQPLGLLAGLLALSGLYILLKASDRQGKIIGLTRILFFVLLAAAVSGPFIQDVKTVEDQKDLVVLEDKSRSASLMEDISIDVENVNVERRTVLRGNNSNLGSALDSELRSGKEYLLLSDGRTSEELDNVLEKYRSENSSISVLKPEIEEESAVYISGPSTTVPGAGTEFTVHVFTTGNEKVPVKVTLDNETVFDSTLRGSWSFNRTFESEQTHRIKAEIQASDRYSENNQYYKTVKIREKPEILYIGEEIELTEKLSRFYDVTVTDEVPRELSDYYSVISTKALNREKIEEYISEGNGYMYLGNYDSPADYLPVEASNENYDTQSTRVIVGIETSSQAGESIRDSKDLAYSLLEELPLNTKVATFYYSQDIHKLSDLTTLAYNRDALLNKIASVPSIAETRHGKGLKAAKELADGEGNIVILTDGNFFEERRVSKEEIKSNAFAEARTTEQDLYIIGVGEDPNTNFLRELADQAPRGEYVSSENVWRLGFQFGAGGGTSAFKPLIVTDTQHFITENTGLETSTSVFNEVRPKNSADVLVSGPGKREFLTSWNYGLGRVAAFSGGQPDLSRILSSNPGLISRTASWTVGNSNRKQDQWIEVTETEAPGSVSIRASYNVEGLTYSSQNRFTGEVNPEGLGFDSFQGEEYSYNYNSEIEKLGYRDSTLDKIASSTDGEVYTPSEFSGVKFEGTGEQQVSYRRPLSKFFILAALVLLVSEVGFRKLNGKK